MKNDSAEKSVSQQHLNIEPQTKKNPRKITASASSALQFDGISAQFAPD